MRFDSLREITASLLAETRKLSYLGITFKTRRSTLADTDKRRPEAIFEAVSRDLYATYRHTLSSDSRSRKIPKMDETAADYRFHDHHTVLKPAFQGCRTSSKDRKKKGGIKVHTVIHTNEGVPSDTKFTSAATNDSFMLKPTTLSKGDIMAMDCAYIGYEKFEQLTRRGVTYVSEIQNLVRYNISDS